MAVMSSSASFRRADELASRAAMPCSCAFSAAALSRSVSMSALVAASLSSNCEVRMKKACASNSRAYARVISSIASSASFTAAALSAA